MADNALIIFYIIESHSMLNSVVEMIVRHKRIIPVILGVVAIGLYMIPISSWGGPVSAQTRMSNSNGGGYGQVVVGGAGGIGGAGGAGGVGGNGGVNVCNHAGCDFQHSGGQQANGGSANGGNGGPANGGNAQQQAQQQQQAQLGSYPGHHQ